MAVHKVVFPVGGLGTRFYPITRAIPKEMLGIIDKPLIHYAFEEALAGGIDQFIFVTRQGKNSIEDYFDGMLSDFENKNGTPRCSFCYVRQSEPRGLGHAVLCARPLIDNEPFAVISADDFILNPQKSCIGEMIKRYDGANMAAVMRVPREEVSKYGILDICREQEDMFIAKSVDEKPDIENAKSDLAIVGRYILSPRIFEVLEHLKPGVKNEIQLTDALLEMIPEIGLKGFKFEGLRFDCGSKSGLLSAVLHLANKTPELLGTLKEFFKEHFMGSV